MSNYTKSTNFATKDNLTPGDPLKVVRGTEIDTEYNNIATAIATKTDNSAAAITGGSITGITDLAVADGGTGASTATAALNNLLPSQTSNANKYLQTDGTNATWDAVSLSTADITGTLPVANGGTGVTSSTGTGSVVLSNSPTLVTPALGTPASGTLTNATGLPISTGVSGLGTGVATFLGTPSSANLASAVTDETGSGALVFANSPTLVTPALGTPSALVGTNITGTASGLTAGNVTTNANLTGAVTSVGNATSLGSFSSANLLGALTDETGTGSAVFATSPTLVTPILGTPTSATLTNATGLPLTTGVTGTLPTANGGTNLTSFTSGGVVYASSSSALATGSALSFNGSNALTQTANSSEIYLAGGGSAAQGGFLSISRGGTTKIILGTASNVLGGGSNTSDDLTLFATADTRFYASSAEGMRLTSTGLGIGTSSVTYKVDVLVTGNNGIRTTSSAGQQLYLGNTGGDAVVGTLNNYSLGLLTNGSVRATLDTSGNLGIGTSSPNILTWNQALTTNTASGNVAYELAIAGAAQAYFGADASNIYLAGYANKPLFIRTNNANAITIDTSQNVGIGTSSPSTPLDVTKAGGANFVATFQNTTAATPYCVFIKDAASSASGYPLLAVTNSTGSATYFRVDSSVGTVGIGTTPNASASDGVLKLSGGITFPATQSASSNANTLDDYEEGSFTPTITFDGASVGVTYNTTFTGATYTKIGNRVCVSGYILLSNKGSSTGGAGISNLPFASETGTTKYLGAFVAGIGVTFANQLWGRMPPSSTTIDCYETTEAGVTTQITNADFSNDSQIYFSATYSV